MRPQSPSTDPAPANLGESARTRRIAADPSESRAILRSSGGAGLTDDTGSAALEFIAVGLLLLVPVVYLVLVLGAVQEQGLGAQAGAGLLARGIATAPNADAARERADRGLASIAREYGLDPGAVSVDVTCTPAGARCPQAGAYLTVRIATRVALPLVPPVLGLDRVASVPIEATATHKVSRFWSER